MTDPFVLGFASSFAATFLYDISIRVLNAISTKSANVNIEQQLKEALQKATILVLKEDIKLNLAIEEIVERIWENRLNNQIISDEKLLFQLSLILEQYDESSITANDLLPAIISALPGEIVKYPQLAAYETLEMLRGLHDLANTLTIDVSEIKNYLARKTPTIVDLKRELEFFSKEINKNLKARNSMVANNRFMPAAYIEYFTRVMFLESNMPDKKRVTLKDVYIKPKFSVASKTLCKHKMSDNFN